MKHRKQFSPGDWVRIFDGSLRVVREHNEANEVALVGDVNTYYAPECLTWIPQRYDWCYDFNRDSLGPMDPAPDGEWVRYDDIKEYLPDHD